MKLIRMTNNEELNLGSNERHCTWWVNVDENNPLIKSLPKLQQYHKDGSFILAEIDDEIVYSGEYTLGNETILQSHNSEGSTGYNDKWNFVSISKNDFKNVEVIHKGKFRVWNELFDIAASNGFITGV